MPLESEHAHNLINSETHNVDPHDKPLPPLAHPHLHLRPTPRYNRTISTPYAWGIAAALLTRICNAAGAILQKSVVNALPAASQQGGLLAALLRRPRWWLALACTLGLGTVFNLTAQSLIGPALVPGLSASRLLFLALGSVWLIGERLRPTEWLGIAALVAGIALLSQSRLEIPPAEVDLFAAGFPPAWRLSASPWPSAGRSRLPWPAASMAGRGEVAPRDRLYALTPGPPRDCDYDGFDCAATLTLTRRLRRALTTAGACRGLTFTN